MRTTMRPAGTSSFVLILTSATILSLAAACGGHRRSSDRATLQQPSPSVVTRSSVVDMLGTTDSSPVGLTITPDSDELVLLDARQGVFVLDGDRRFRRVARADDLYAQLDADSDFTDIAALGSGKFALTAWNDGFLLDLADGSIRQHFCYVPGGLFPNPNLIVQVTDGCAFDRHSGRIIAQPVTYLTASGIATQSEVGTFPITGGEGQDWHPIPDTWFLAGAITVDADGALWLARGRELYQYDLTSDTLIDMQSLQRFAVLEVVGMVFDGDDLMVLDGPSRTIVRIPAALL